MILNMIVKGKVIQIDEEVCKIMGKLKDIFIGYCTLNVVVIKLLF